MDEAKVNKYTADSDKWDSGELGADEKYVVAADETVASAVDEALKMQLISIRFPKKMVDDMKLIARAHGVGYQPLIRDIMSRFIQGEMKAMMRDALERRKQEEDRLRLEEAKAQEEIAAYQEKQVA